MKCRRCINSNFMVHGNLSEILPFLLNFQGRLSVWTRLTFFILKWNQPPAAEAAVEKQWCCCCRTTVSSLVAIKWFIIWQLLRSVSGFLLLRALSSHSFLHHSLLSGWQWICAFANSLVGQLQRVISVQTVFYMSKLCTCLNSVIWLNIQRKKISFFAL